MRVDLLLWLWFWCGLAVIDVEFGVRLVWGFLWRVLVLLIVLLLVRGITFACVVCSFVVCLRLVALLFCDGFACCAVLLLVGFLLYG